MTKPLILVDGSSYFYRAFHALPPLTNSKGQPTGAVYGVANMVKKLLKDYQPKHMAVIFDPKGKTFREDWYPEYKAHRPPTPADLSCQFQPLLKLLTAMGLPPIIVEGVEADDVIGTLAKAAVEQGIPVLISTGDKDMAQLVNEQVTLINTMSNQVLDVEGVKTKFGIYPEQIIDYLTLMGDSVDNVPGVTKCGPKTAVKWLEQYKNLDQIIQNSNSVTGKIGEYLREAIPKLPLSKRLVTIKTDVELPILLENLEIGTPQLETLIELTTGLEFKSWLKEFLAQKENTIEPLTPINKNKTFTIVQTAEQLQDLIKHLQQAKIISFGVETTNPDFIQAPIIGISFATEVNNPFYIPMLHKDNTTQLSAEMVWTTLKPILEDPKIGKLGHNLKYDYNILKNQGITLRNIQHDIMLESYILNSSSNQHGIASLALKYLGYKTTTLEDILGKGSKQLSFDEIDLNKAAPYAAEDADITLKLHETLYPLLEQSPQSVLNEIEIPLIPVLAEMECKGVLIDTQKLEAHGKRLKTRMAELEAEAVLLAGKSFNLLSPKQLQEILFEEQKLPILSKTPTGQPSTAESVLQELAFEYRLPALILEYRGLSKLTSTYIDALPKRVNPATGRVHTCYNQAVAATGRLSSTEPNLQNIPIRTEEGRLIRTTFIAPEHFTLVAADYSQIELRIMAHLSKDPNLLLAFEKGWDIHRATASEIFQIPLEQISSEQRRRAKAINFGLIYGMSAFGLSRQLGIERNDAQEYMNRYFQRYPGVLRYMESTVALARTQGYVETLFGRRLYIPEIQVSNQIRRKAAERIAINAPMQGTAADIIKKAMLALFKWQNTLEKDAVSMIMQVHDELVFEVKNEILEHAKENIKQLMENAVHLSVPLEVSVGSGVNWDEAH
jgi:DNA polymerase-1